MPQDNQTLAGVVGVDIPVSRFESFSPRSQLGPMGYTFAINSNGFLIFHPDLWMVSNYLEDPAHNDLADVEGNSEAITALRREMIEMAAIDPENGDATVKSVSLEASVILQQGHSATIEVDYHYAPILGTTFS